MESILVSIRTGLGLEADYKGFDGEILMAINNAIMFLSQLGVSSAYSFNVTGEQETWEQLTGTFLNISSIKTYILLRTRLEFDPPSNSYMIDSIKHQLSEIEWRLSVEIDSSL